MSIIYAAEFVSTPLGTLRIIASPSGIVRVDFDGDIPENAAKTESTPAAVHLRLCFDEISRYFKGELRTYSVPLAHSGTPFQRSVWEFVRHIPYGETRSYGEVAALLGYPRAARGVGAANARNPVSILIPCHRLVGSRGQLAGYAGGIERKRQLLELEKGRFPDNDI